MGKKLLKLIMLFAVACISFSCRNSDDIDNNTGMYSNIDSLYAQPLPVIQKCVQGKWKWISNSTCGVVGPTYRSNTVIEITKDKVVTTGDEGRLNQAFSFSYHWEKLSTPEGYTTYVMWNNEQNNGEWYFDRIQNDLLIVYSYFRDNCGYTVYSFKRKN